MPLMSVFRYCNSLTLPGLAKLLLNAKASCVRDG